MTASNAPTPLGDNAGFPSASEPSEPVTTAEIIRLTTPGRSRPPNSWPREESFPDTAGLRRMTYPVSGRQTWGYRYTDPVTGKRNLHTLGPCESMDEIEARVRAREIRRDLERGISPKRSSITLTVLFDVVYLPCAERNNKGSWRDDKSRFDQLIRPVLGHRVANTIRSEDIRQLAEDLVAGRLPGARRTHYAQGTANHVVNLLKAIYRVGVEKKVVSNNPAREVRVRPAQNHRRVVFTPSDLEALIPALQNVPEKQRLLIVFLLATSARIGEIRGARHVDVDVAARTLFIPKAKNRQSVTLPLSDVAMQAYEEVRGLRREGNPYLFPAVRGEGPMATPRKAFNQLLASVGIEHRTFHDLRRTAITTAVQLPGVTLLDASRMANHSSTRITEDRYVALPLERIRHVASAVADHMNLQQALQPVASPPVESSSDAKEDPMT